MPLRCFPVAADVEAVIAVGVDIRVGEVMPDTTDCPPEILDAVDITDNVPKVVLGRG